MRFCQDMLGDTAQQQGFNHAFSLLAHDDQVAILDLFLLKDVEGRMPVQDDRFAAASGQTGCFAQSLELFGSLLLHLRAVVPERLVVNAGIAQLAFEGDFKGMQQHDFGLGRQGFTPSSMRPWRLHLD